MKKLTEDEIKQESYAILKVVHAFCVENNIRYYMDYGTLLGAVRHKGFIPWDDDIDICMPRSDYEKFIRMFNVENYYVKSYHNEDKFVLSYAKVSSTRTVGFYKDYKLDFGLSIDIFPIDGIPESNKDSDKLYKKISKLFFLWFLRIKEYEIIEKITSKKDFVKKMIVKIISSKSIAKKLNKIASSNDFEKSKYAGCVVAPFFKKLEIAEQKSYASGILMDFEDSKFYAPIGYHDVLVSEFGEDYMTPPPEDQRGSAHSTEFYYWR